MKADMVQQLRLGDDARRFAEGHPTLLVTADAAGYEPIDDRQVAAVLHARATAAGFAGEIGTALA